MWKSGTIVRRTTDWGHSEHPKKGELQTVAKAWRAHELDEAFLVITKEYPMLTQTSHLLEEIPLTELCSTELAIDQQECVSCGTETNAYTWVSGKPFCKTCTPAHAEEEELKTKCCAKTSTAETAKCDKCNEVVSTRYLVDGKWLCSLCLQQRLLAESGKWGIQPGCCDPSLRESLPKPDEIVSRFVAGTPAGRKDDEGKLDWDLLPIEAMEEVIKVLMHGATKYGRENWKDVAQADKRYYNAAMRHLTAWRQGKLLDPETQFPHLAHAMCCMLFLLSFDMPLVEAKKPEKIPSTLWVPGHATEKTTFPMPCEKCGKEVFTRIQDEEAWQCKDCFIKQIAGRENKGSAGRENLSSANPFSPPLPEPPSN